MLQRFLIILILVLIAQPAWAARIDAKGAEKLGAIFEKFMAARKTALEADGTTKVSYDGVAVVEPARSYYAVTLPHTKITYADGSRLDIGMISINATPHNEDGQWKMTAAIPMPITMNGVHGSLQTKTSIGEQRAAGIWDEGLESFSKLDAVYKNIIVENYSYPYSITIPSLQIVYDMTKDEQGLWSGPGHMALDRLSVVIPSQKLQGHVANIRSDFTLDHYNPQAIKTYQEKMGVLTKKLGAQAAANAQTLPIQMKDLYGPMLDFFMTSGNGLQVDYEISDVNFSWQGRDGKTPGLFKLDSGALGTTMTGFNTDLASMNMRLKFEGLEEKTIQTAKYKKLSPARANMDIAMQNIPIRQIAGLATNTMAAMSDPDMAPLAGLSLMMKVPAMLSQAGALLTVKDNSFGNGDYNVALNGTAKADMAALNSAVINAQAVFTGLDKMIEAAKSQAAAKDAETAEQGKELLKQLQVIKAQARVEAVEGAPTKHVIDFVMNEKGQMLVNGKALESVVFGKKP
ncbi:MAG: hypothetical protein ACT4OY_04355 [Alphaproteobacteria bacterium]